MSLESAALVFHMDPRGHLVERVQIDGQEVHLHYRDVPESDITTLHGVRLTTPLRTVIDIAPMVDGDQLELMVQDCLERGLFTIEEAWQRIAQPDMLVDPGAIAMGRLLGELG